MFYFLIVPSLVSLTLSPMETNDKQPLPRTLVCSNQATSLLCRLQRMVDQWREGRFSKSVLVVARTTKQIHKFHSFDYISLIISNYVLL